MYELIVLKHCLLYIYMICLEFRGKKKFYERVESNFINSESLLIYAI